MNLSDHAKSTEKRTGHRCEDIHRWIDEFFNHDLHRFRKRMGYMDDYNPYEHRKHRHFIEALESAVSEFKDRYSEQLIKEVFIIHLEDDYNGYIPKKKDFENFDFLRRYHRIYI